MTLHALAAPLLVLSMGVAAAQPAPESKALLDLNDAFRKAYAGAKQRMLAGAGPVIVANGDTAVLVRNGSRKEAVVNAPSYHTVKAIAHVPLAVFVALTPGEGDLPADRRATLTELRALIPPARAILDTLKMPPATVARQEKITSQSLAFLDDVLAKGRYTRAALESYTRKMSPLVMENAADATRAELDILHAQVTAWRKEMTADEWSKLRVVVVGPHMPREGLVVTQYFA
jgi:hypothetical protein